MTTPQSDTPRCDSLFCNPPTNDEAYDFARTLERELDEALKWKNEDPRMLREQIRVADAAFNRLQEELNKANQQAALYLKDRDVVMQQRDEARKQVEELRTLARKLVEALEIGKGYMGEVEASKYSMRPVEETLTLAQDAKNKGLI